MSGILQSAFICVSLVASAGGLSLHRLGQKNNLSAVAADRFGFTSRKAVDFSGKRVALAWHGIYQRHHVHDHGGKRVWACSDFFSVASNVKEFIDVPLRQAGAKVTNYVHTYTRYDCPRKDRKLLKSLSPKSHKFWNVSDHRIVDSYIEVLRMVEEDKDSIDFVVVLRFDVKYKVPITQWGMTLDTIGIPFRDKFSKWAACSQVSDLLFTLPTRYIDPLIRALDWSGKRETNFEHTLREGSTIGAPSKCFHQAFHYSGHFVMQPLFNELGGDALHIMQAGNFASDLSFDETEAFLGIDRSCSDKYWSNCKHANHEWVDNGLWLAEESEDAELIDGL